MARGVEFEALNKRWMLRFDTNALCSVEAELKLPFAKIIESLQAGSICAQRALLRAAMGGKITSELAGEVMDDLGLERVAGLLGDAIELAFPQAAAEGDAPGN